MNRRKLLQWVGLSGFLATATRAMGIDILQPPPAQPPANTLFPFLILVRESYSLTDELAHCKHPLLRRLRYCDDPYIMVVWCKHEKLEDNLVKVVIPHSHEGRHVYDDEYSLLEAADTWLYLADEMLTEAQVATMFTEP